jgi:hypothetical protein
LRSPAEIVHPTSGISVVVPSGADAYDEV